ncbi:MAG: hypothetical protein EOO95_04770 [Pedobacter sp.]|nr:MAG: hypothetical protein EOO95_04770 [Pedobacter sp.]
MLPIITHLMKLITLFVSVVLMGFFTDIASLRKQYIAAAESEQEANELHQQLEKVDETGKEFTKLGYKSAAIVLQAKYAKGLLTKKNLFTKGVKLLDATIDRAPNNYEVRLLRLNIQENAPGITGYTKNIKEDKAFLIKNYNSQPADLREFTKDFVEVSESFTKQEKALF